MNLNNLSQFSSSHNSVLLNCISTSKKEKKRHVKYSGSCLTCLALSKLMESAPIHSPQQPYQTYELTMYALLS